MAAGIVKHVWTLKDLLFGSSMSTESERLKRDARVTSELEKEALELGIEIPNNNDWWWDDAEDQMA